MNGEISVLFLLAIWDKKYNILLVLLFSHINMTPDVVAYPWELAMYYVVRTLIIIVAIRDGIRKAIALRKAAWKKQIVRFICLFVFNTAGVLPIIYILFFGNKKEKSIDMEIKDETRYWENPNEENIKKTAAKIEKLIKKTSSPKSMKKTPTKKTTTKKIPSKKTK